MVLTLKVTVGFRRAHIQTFPVKSCTHVSDALVRTPKKKWGAVGTSTCADASAFTSDPQLSSYCRRFQTGATPQILAHMFRLLGPRVSRRSFMLDSLVRVVKQQR